MNEKHHQGCCSCHAKEEVTCGCGCANEHTEGERGKWLIRFGIGGFVFLIALLLKGRGAEVLLFVAYLLFGYDVLLRAGQHIGKGKFFDENFLMAISTIGALCLGEQAEAVFVMAFYQVGEMLQSYAVTRSRKSITALLNIRPDFARRIIGKKTEEVEPDSVLVGEWILVKAGERIPLDGYIEEGVAFLDMSALTGEALPKMVQKGDRVHSGCINIDGSLRICVEKPYAESTVVKILELVEQAADKKSHTERFITRFAKIYTPIVCLLAGLVAVLPPVLFQESVSVWLGRALIFLVVSCPCALVLSIPLGYFAGIGAASAKGILVKGGNNLDMLSELEQVVFDKTGTLTEGKFSIVERKGDVLALAAIGESRSNHPIAKAITQAYTGEIPEIKAYREWGGYGISYLLEGEIVRLGNAQWMEKAKIPYEKAEHFGTVVYVAKGEQCLGYLIVADTKKEKVEEALSALKKEGIQKMVMLTGDKKETAEALAKELRLDAVYSELLPQDKVKWMECLKGEGKKTAFVGDGINDAPVLAMADLGIAMGGIGSDAAIEAADVVLMEDEIGKLAVGIRIAKNTKKMIYQNITLALGCKFLVLLLSVFGMATMWMAVFADVGVCVLAILNVMRKKV